MNVRKLKVCLRVKGWKIVFNVFMNNKNYVTLTFHTPVWYVQWYILYLCSTTRSFVLTRILTSKGRLKRGPFILKLYQTTFKYKFPFFLSYYPLTCNIVCILRKEPSFAIKQVLIYFTTFYVNYARFLL